MYVLKVLLKLNADVKTLYIEEKDNGIDSNHMTIESMHLTTQVARGWYSYNLFFKFVLRISCRNVNVCDENTEKFPGRCVFGDLLFLPLYNAIAIRYETGSSHVRYSPYLYVLCD